MSQAKPPGLTTHVLDTARGGPAVGVVVELWRIEEGARHCLVRTETNRDGRTDAPLLDQAAFAPGTYELMFWTGEWFRAQGLGADPPFHDVITLRVVLAGGQGHYHVPLLVSPFAYSTYRGS